MRENKKAQLSKDEMLSYLYEINDRLATTGKHGEILLAGGAAMSLVFDARGFTKDMDVLFHPTDDIRKIVREMADKHSLRDDWLNDGVKGYITPQMKIDVFLELSNLTVKNVNAESILAMKLTAARDSTTKDLEDSVLLMNILGIKNEEQLFDIVKKYTSINVQTPKVKYFAIEAFNKYSKEK